MKQKTIGNVRSHSDWRFQLKQLWNDFDPIGVLGPGSDCPDDEYESYIMPTFTLLKKEVDFAELNNYITFTVKEHMGIPLSDEDIANFARILQLWHIRYYSNTFDKSYSFKKDDI